MAYEARPAFSTQNMTNLVVGIPVVGTGEGTFLTITQDVDSLNFAPDCDGAIYTNLVANNMSTAVMRTYFGNPANPILQVAFETGRTGGISLPSSFVAIGGLGAVLNSTSAVNSYIVKSPTQIYAKEASAQIWDWTVKLLNTLRV